VSLSIWSREQDVSDSDAETGVKRRKNRRKTYWDKKRTEKGEIMSFIEDMWKLLRGKKQFSPLGTICQDFEMP